MFHLKRQRRSKSGFEENYEEENDKSKIRKIIHRDVERQRRQEMANLYASLRVLIPHEYIKGKRSIPDHMDEAVKYIKNMETKINELRIRRDKLSKSFGSKNGSSNSVINLPNCVTINYCLNNTVEILISCELKGEQGFHLSNVLIELIAKGLNTISCISSRIDGKFIYRIQSEVNDLAFIDLPVLQQRLENVINFG